jgi:hypothetical protein
MRHGVHYRILEGKGRRLVGDRFMVPETFTLEVDDLGLDCLVILEVDNTGPEPACVEVRAKRRSNGPPVTGTTLRGVRLGTYLREGTEMAAAPVVDRDVMMTVYPADDEHIPAYRRARGQEKQPSRRIPDETLARVAEVYRRALGLGQPPTAAVERELKLRSRAQAARWVAKARSAKLLGPAPALRVRGEQPLREHDQTEEQ